MQYNVYIALILIGLIFVPLSSSAVDCTRFEHCSYSSCQPPAYTKWSDLPSSDASYTTTSVPLPDYAEIIPKACPTGLVCSVSSSDQCQCDNANDGYCPASRFGCNNDPDCSFNPVSNINSEITNQSVSTSTPISLTKFVLEAKSIFIKFVSELSQVAVPTKNAQEVT